MKAIKQRYANIDCAKNVFSLCVVAIHVFTLASVENIILNLFINGIARLAVPFFFCCNGFFIAQKGIHNRTYLIRFTKKAMKTYVYLTAIYSPFVIGELFYNGKLDLTGLLHYFHRAIVEGSYLHLWYLPATVLAVWVLHFITVCKLKSKLIITISWVLYAFGLFGDSYYGILKYLPPIFNNFMTAYETIFLTTRNGLFFGFPFVTMGYFIWKNTQSLTNFSAEKGLLASCVLLPMESSILYWLQLPKDYNLMISLVPVLYFGFSILLNQSNFNLKSLIVKKGFSTFIYYYHILAFGLVLGCNAILQLDVLSLPAVQFILVIFALVAAFRILKKS